MISPESKLIVASAGATVVALGALALVEDRLGYLGEWAIVLTFVLWVTLAYAVPQALLMRVDGSVSRTSRMGVITLMVVVLAGVFSDNITWLQSTVLWSMVGVSVPVIFGHAIRSGYRSSRPKQTR